MKTFFSLIALFFSTVVFTQEKAYVPEEVDEFPVIHKDLCTENLSERDCFQLQLMDFVNGKIAYPEDALRDEVEGVVYMQFVIDENGSVKDIKARSIREDFKNEAVRVLHLLPKVKPALKNGNPVAFVFGFPVNFAIKKNEIPKIEYFPQEQLIHPNVQENQDHNAYLYNSVQNQLVAILAQKSNLSLIQKNVKDTLSISLSFEVDSEGNVKKDKNRILTGSRALYEKLGPKLERILNSLPQFKVQNRKPDPIVSRHHLIYEFVVEGKKEMELMHIPNTEKYEGGSVDEIPIFPRCEEFSLVQENAKKCFQLKMQEHIKNHFKYPEEAQMNGISGKVNVVLIIAKTGEIKNIRTRGPHKVLEKEAVRIIELLPKMVPGRKNGKPVDVPYSIPIIFKI